MGLTHSDQRQPGSNVARIAVTSPSLTTSSFPLSIERVSSGLSKLFRSIFAIAILLLNVTQLRCGKGPKLHGGHGAGEERSDGGRAPGENHGGGKEEWNRDTRAHASVPSPP